MIKAEIVMLGDSLTYGTNWFESRKLNIANHGINGDTSNGVLNRIEKVCNLHPQKCFIMIGINDLYHCIELAQIFENYKNIISILKSKNIECYLQSTLYVNNQALFNYIEINKKVDQLNQLLKDHCDKNKIVFIDLNSKLSNRQCLKKELSYDGLHLNPEGYIIWESVVKEYI